MILLAIGNRTDRITHAVFHDHAADDARRLLDIAGCARADLAEHNLLGHASAERDLDAVDELGTRPIGTILLWQGEHIAARTSARDDRYLVHGIGVLEQKSYERMSALMICREALFLIRHDMGLALRTCEDTLNRLLHLRHRDLLLVTARGKECRLVDEVAQIRSRKAGRAPREDVQINVVGDWLALCMYLQNGLTSAHVGLIHHDLTIETAGAQERRIKHIGAVGRRDDDDPLI